MQERGIKERGIKIKKQGEVKLVPPGSTFFVGAYNPVPPDSPFLTSKQLYHKKYNKEYHKKNKKRKAELLRQWRQKNKEKAKKWRKENYKKNKDKQDTQSRRWHEEHPDCIKNWRKNNKESIIKYKRYYAKTPKGIMVWKRARFKRRKLGSFSLNNYFVGSHGHHILPEYIIYIPEELHRSIQHSLTQDKKMFEINRLAIEFLNQKLGG